MTYMDTSGAAYVRPDPSDCIHHFLAMFDKRKCIRCGWDFRNGSPPEKDEDRPEVAPDAANTGGADVLATWDALVKCAYRSDDIPPHESELDAARTAVAALIEREAALASKLEGARIACDNLTASLSRAEAERDALAAEVKALRDALILYREAIHYAQDKGALMAAIKEADEAAATVLARASAATGGGNG